MKNVISASRRTDIPAFYLKWFMDAISRGELEIINPLYHHKSTRISLKPDDVAWIVFWSRNYDKFLKKRHYFSVYELFFHFTILTPSGMEKTGIPLSRALKQMEQLAYHYGSEYIVWRYDPIIHWTEGNTVQTNYDPDSFKMLCEEISKIGIQRCYISFVQHYGKFIRRFAEKFPNFSLHQLCENKRTKIAGEIARMASSYRITVYSCCNDDILSVEGIEKGRCIDGNLLNHLAPDEKVSRAFAPTRKQCGCTKSIDIGDYENQPCPFGCIYCYANPLWK